MTQQSKSICYAKNMDKDDLKYNLESYKEAKNFLNTKNSKYLGERKGKPYNILINRNGDQIIVEKVLDCGRWVIGHPQSLYGSREFVGWKICERGIDQETLKLIEKK